MLLEMPEAAPANKRTHSKQVTGGQENGDLVKATPQLSAL